VSVLNLQKIKERVFRYIVYFRRGHGSWLAYLISFTNFVVIQYRLLIERVPFLESLIPSFTAFVVTFFLIYVPLAIVIGRYDIKRATVPKEVEVRPFFYRPIGKEEKVYAPVWDAVLSVLEKIAEKEDLKGEVKKVRETREILKMWAAWKYPEDG